MLKLALGKGQDNKTNTQEVHSVKEKAEQRTRGSIIRSSSLMILYNNKIIKEKENVKMMQFNTKENITMQNNTIQNKTIQYDTIQYDTIQYNKVKYNTIYYNAIKYNQIQYNTIQ